MVQDDKTTAADKGKGKAVENGKAEEFPKDKDGKPLANGKKEDEKDDCMRLTSPIPPYRANSFPSQPQKTSARRTSN